MNKNVIEKIIRNEPLFEGNISMKNIQSDSISKSNLMVGVGLCTSNLPSEGIPFDILTFFLLPELLRQQGIIEKTFLLIADTHAETNSFMTHSHTERLTKCMEATALSIIRSLRLQDFNIIRASDIRREKSFKDTLNSIPVMENLYLREEVSDLLWMEKQNHVKWKLGWTISNSNIPQGHDERFFDLQAKQLCTTAMNFLYTSAGRTFDRLKPKASPYISTANADRIILSKDENMMTKIAHTNRNSEHIVAAMNHLERIVRLFEKLVVRIPLSRFEEKIEFIHAITTQDLIAMI